MNESDLSTIPGIGPKKKALLANLGVNEIEDLMHFYPRKFKDYGNVISVSKLSPSELSVVCVKISKKQINRSRNGKQFISLSCYDPSGKMQLLFFNMNFLYNNFATEKTYYFYGKTSFDNRMPQMVNPELVGKEDLGRILPVYKTLPGLSQKDFRKGIMHALNHFQEEAEWIPREIMGSRGFPSKVQALRSIHFPENRASYNLAKRRLVYEEFFILQMAVVQLKKTRLAEYPPVRMRPFSDKFEEAIGSLPFALTKGQSSALKSLADCFARPNCPKILLQGDVGTGKTLIAFFAALLAHHNGFQSAIMAPTELLAEQHYKNFTRLFAHAGMKSLLLTGSTPQKAQKKSMVEKGDYHLVIGTQALIQQDTRFKKLGLIITDEQHRFGVSQRNTFIQKGRSPHVLVMSATPIPRTISEIIFGDMHILRLREKPNSDSKPIETRLIASKKDETRMLKHISDEMLAGRQVYYVCPRIDEDSGGAASVEKIFHQLKTSAFDSFRLSMLHGRMSSEEKESVMRDFRDGKIQMLVATSVIEVGIDVPNATIMAIDSFEHFGLAQIHQLRGRVGRGSFDSHCYLISRNSDAAVHQKADILRKYRDGFEIAKQDMKIRGPGHVFSLKQHGFPEFKIADLFKHYNILIDVQSDIRLIYGNRLDDLQLEPALAIRIRKYIARLSAGEI